MSFGWINGTNAVVIIYLIVINIIMAKKNIAGSFSSKHPLINIFEQIGRYGCMAFMVLPIAVQNWEFGFRSVTSMLIWLCLTTFLMFVYCILWSVKNKGKKANLYGLAIIPVCLFLMNGILLHHILLIVFAIIFGICHLMIVNENV